MKISSVTIKNFKAIEKTTVPLSQFTVIVGTNGSGKSSILQSLHWMLQSARNLRVKPEREGKGSTLSELDATYMPSPEYKNSSNSAEYGNGASAPRMDITLEAEIEDSSSHEISMWIKSAKNEGVSVHVPSKHPLTAVIRHTKREISAYIPGLAGIPLSEEKRSKKIIHRLAAAGDANTVLRNLLALLQTIQNEAGETGLKEVSRLASKVVGPITLDVAFDEEAHFKIHAHFQTDKMKAKDAKLFKPLELAGIGFLQVIQIFAYLVYFRPRLLLVDEPDSHLHPDVQEKLTQALFYASKKYDCQIILSTHSPSVVRSLPGEASIVWMRDGAVASSVSDDIRVKMGWGLLDKRVLLVTEDKRAGMLRNILGQWPELERITAVWPTKGSSGLPPAESMAGLSTLFGTKLKMILHRDSDFMTSAERDDYILPYNNKNIDIWLTEGSDIESYWINDPVLSAHFKITTDEARNLIHDACDLLDSENAAQEFSKKRREVTNKLPSYANHSRDVIGTAEARQELSKSGREFCYIGKDLIGAIRRMATQNGYKGASSLTKNIPGHGQIKIATDLKQMLTTLTSTRKKTLSNQ